MVYVDHISQKLIMLVLFFCYSTHRGYAWYNTKINEETEITNEKNHSIISQKYLHLNIIHQSYFQEGAQIDHFCL